MGRRSRVMLNPTSDVCKKYMRSWPKHFTGKGRRKKKRQRPQTFAQIIQGLGFESYAEYLESSFWAEIRLNVFISWGSRCRGCGQAATEVHHSSYSQPTMAGTTLDHLWPICHDCHRSIHDGSKDLRIVNKRLIQMWKDRKPPIGKRS